MKGAAADQDRRGNQPVLARRPTNDFSDEERIETRLSDDTHYPHQRNQGRCNADHFQRTQAYREPPKGKSQNGIRAGADPGTLFEVISSSAGNWWLWQNRVPHSLAGDDTPLSAVNIFVKDLGIVLDQARALTFPLPMASAAHQLFLAAAAHGEGAKDDAFVIRVWQALAGIELP